MIDDHERSEGYEGPSYYIGVDLGQAMRAIAALCKRRPNAQFVIVGGDEVSYGSQAPGGQTWREVALKEVTLTYRK